MLRHLLGLDGEEIYNVYSGPLPVLLSLGFLGTWWHHINCTEPGCWRKGHKDPEHGHPRCRRHQEKLH
jgi:hypothetical protein